MLDESSNIDHNPNLIIILIMSQPFKEFLKRLGESQKRLVDYWKRSPTNKLILINTGVYVHLLLSSACGN